jgi:hypothetical protein
MSGFAAEPIMALRAGSVDEELVSEWTLRTRRDKKESLCPQCLCGDLQDLLYVDEMLF